MSHSFVGFMVGLLFVAQTNVQAAENCPIDIDSLPRCENGTGLVSEHLPSQVVFLSLQLNASDAAKILKAIDGTSTKLTVKEILDLEETIGQNSSLKSLIERVKAKNAVEIPSGMLPGGHYIRDEFIFQFDSNKKLIKFFSTSPPSEDKKVTDKFCGMDFQFSKDFRLGDTVEFGKVPDLGGNFMVLPGGVCAVGNEMKPELSKNLCGKAPKISIDTDSTAVGHVDEVMNVLPDHRRPPPCDFSVVRPSSRLFINALGNDFDKPFFKNLDEIKKSEKSNHCESGKCYKVTEFCDLYSDYIYLLQFQKHIQSSNNQTTPDVKAKQVRGVAGRFEGSDVSEADKKRYEAEDLKKEKYRLQLVADKEEYADIYKFDSEFKAPDCSKMTNREVALMIQGSNHFSVLQGYIKRRNSKSKVSFKDGILNRISEKLYELENFKYANEQFDISRQNNIEKVMSHLPPQCKGKDMVIDVPSLIYNGSSLNPNPVNMTVIGKSIFYPEQFNDQVADAIEKTLQKTGKNPESLNTFFFHSGKGNVHCLTNEFRMCKP